MTTVDASAGISAVQRWESDGGAMYLGQFSPSTVEGGRDGSRVRERSLDISVRLSRT